MLRHPKTVLMSALLLMMFFLPGSLNAASLIGQVIDGRRDTPIPGMEVVLYHPQVGPSRPRYTGPDGVFFFSYVPRVRGDYDLEFYWRGRLIDRIRISIEGDVRMDPIRF